MKQLNLLLYFIEHSPAALAMFDSDMRYMATSRRWLDDYHLADQSTIGKTYYEVFPGSEQEWKTIHQRCLNGEVEIIPQKQFTHANGTTDWIRWEVRPWHKSDGKISGVIIFSEVITEKVLAMEKLLAIQETSRHIMNSALDAIIGMDKKGVINMWTPRAEMIFGWKAQEVLDKKLSEVIIPHRYREKHEQGLSRFLETGKSTILGKPQELSALHRDGFEIPIELSIVLVSQIQEDFFCAFIRDITERKKATELFKYQFENSPDIILIINRDLIIETINKGRPDGLTATDLVGKHSIEVLPESSRPIALEHVMLCFETGQNQEIEYQLIGDRWVRSRFVPIVLDGNIDHIMIIATDVTERNLFVEQLKQSEEKNRALVENISDTIIVLNQKAEIIYKNPGYTRTSGFSIDDLRAKTVYDLVHPQDQEKASKIFNYILENPAQPLQTEFRVMRKDGHYFWAEASIVNFLDNVSVKGIIINYRDISERIKFEEQQRLMTSIVNSSEDAIISVSLEEIITSWNHGAESILGFSAAEIIGQSTNKIIPSNLENEEGRILSRILKGQSVDHYETTRRKKDGELIYVSLTVSPIYDSENNVIGASKILRDISQQKEMELEREKTMGELLQRNRDLEQFSHIVSHNLRGPVASMLGLSDMLQNIPLSTEEKEQVLQGVDASAKKLDTVIRDLNIILDVKQSLSETKETIVFSELLDVVKVSLNSLIGNENAQFVCDFTPAPEITTIRSFLFSIFYNLISNSIKFRKPDTDPVIHITSEKIDHKIILHFKDNGLGVDLTQQGRDIFGLYERFHLHIEGKGMGLFMVKTQVQALGGKISVHSEENIGTEFTIVFEA